MNLIKKEFKQIISNKLFIAVWLGILVLLCLGMSNVFKLDGEKTQVDGAVLGIANDDISKYSDMLVDFISGSEKFADLITVKTGTQEEMQELFYAGELDAYIDIPDDFINNIMNLESTPIRIKVSDEDSVTAILVSNILSSYQKYITSIQFNITGLYDCLGNTGMKESKRFLTCFNVTYTLVEEVFDKEKYIEDVEVTDYSTTPILTYFLYSAISIIIMYGSLFAGIEILKEKSYSVLDRYIISGRNKFTFILNKLFFYSLAMYLLVFIPTIVSSIVNDTKPNILMLFMYITYIILVVSVSIFLCFLCGNINSYVLVGNIFYIVSIIIGGGIIPIMYMPNNMQKIAEFTLSRVFIKNFISINNGMGIQELKGQIILCYVISLLLICISVILFGRRRSGNDE